MGGANGDFSGHLAARCPQSKIQNLLYPLPRHLLRRFPAGHLDRDDEAPGGVPDARKEDPEHDGAQDARPPADGHGSMQVHNHEAKQTLFALNKWKAGGSAELGIGNHSGGNPDWTFAATASSYRTRRLRVLVHCK